MSEPLRKRKQAPESYTPKQPEIACMMHERMGQVRHIGEIQPLQHTFEIFYLPACRVIGVEQTYGPEPGGDHAAAPQWGRVIQSAAWKTISILPRVISGSCCGWTCDYNPDTKTFQYLVAVLTLADTAVPDGCQFRDVPPTLVAVGRWAEPMDQVVEQMQQHGFISHWGEKGCEWNAELYLDAEEHLPAPNGQEWRWMIPCKREDAK